MVEFLRRCNKILWRLENKFRIHEREAEFGPSFVIIARLIGRVNDKRAALKGLIDVSLGAGDQSSKTYTDLNGR